MLLAIFAMEKSTVIVESASSASSAFLPRLLRCRFGFFFLRFHLFQFFGFLTPRNNNDNNNKNLINPVLLIKYNPSYLKQLKINSTDEIIFYRVLSFIIQLLAVSFSLFMIFMSFSLFLPS